MNNEAIFHDKGLKLIDKLALLLLDENRRQINKWGYQKHDILKWMAIIGEEVGELNKAALEFSVISETNKTLDKLTTNKISNIKHEAIQVATLALKVVGMCEEKLNSKEVEDA